MLKLFKVRGRQQPTPPLPTPSGGLGRRKAHRPKNVELWAERAKTTLAFMRKAKAPVQSKQVAKLLKGHKGMAGTVLRSLLADKKINKIGNKGKSVTWELARS